MKRLVGIIESHNVPVTFTGNVPIKNSYDETLQQNLILTLKEGLAFISQLGRPVSKILIEAEQVGDELHYEVRFYTAQQQTALDYIESESTSRIDPSPSST